MCIQKCQASTDEAVRDCLGSLIHKNDKAKMGLGSYCLLHRKSQIKSKILIFNLIVKSFFILIMQYSMLYVISYYIINSPKKIYYNIYIYKRKICIIFLITKERFALLHAFFFFFLAKQHTKRVPKSRYVAERVIIITSDVLNNISRFTTFFFNLLSIFFLYKIKFIIQIMSLNNDPKVNMRSS